MQDCELQNIIHSFNFRRAFQILEGKTEKQIIKEDELESKAWDKACNDKSIIEIK